MHITTQPITLDTFNLASNERRLCVEALSVAGNLVGAAFLDDELLELLGAARGELLLGLPLDQDVEPDHGRPPRTFLSNSSESEYSSSHVASASRSSLWAV